ncbi:MAG: HAD family hydrolase [Microbacteriaceae bacterium]|nr:HAD family hydrolase [Microbacteriaceae bacterium]
MNSETSPKQVIAFFDCDNTLIRGSSLFYIGKQARKEKYITRGDIVKFAARQFYFLYRGEKTKHIHSSKDRALELLAGQTEETLAPLIDHVVDDLIMPRQFTEIIERVEFHKSQGHQTWMLSATPEPLAVVIAKRLGLDGAIATEIEVVDGVYTGNLVSEPTHKALKLKAAEDKCAELGIDMADCWGYSDSKNDLPLLEGVGNPVAVNPDKTLNRIAKERGWLIIEPDVKRVREQKRNHKQLKKIAADELKKAQKNKA